MRILVIQTAFLGDCVLTLPFLARLCESFPQAQVDVVATGPGAELFRIALERGLAPQASRIRVVEYDKKKSQRGFWASRRFARELRTAGTPYAYAFCIQRSLRTALLAIMSGAIERVGFSSGSVAFLYTRLIRRDWENGRFENEKNLDLLRGLVGAENVPTWKPSSAPSLLHATQRTARKNFANPSAPVLLSLGSPWPTKRWPVENAVPLVEKLTNEGTEVHLIGDAATIPLSQALRDRVPSLLLKDLTGKTQLREWIDRISDAQAVISSDSAAVHVASDLGVPIIALFGPTLPEFGFAPWRAQSSAVGIELACRPCHIHGPKKCPLGHHHCLRHLDSKLVESELRKFLDPAPGTR